jgi:tripeptide aminopeptidase
MDSCGEKFGSNAGNVYATLKGDENREPILFSAHMDTVVPGIGVKPVIKEGVIRSDGTTVLGGDDKSGVAAVVEALRTVKEENISHPTIEIVFTVCEEVGLLGSANLDYSRITAKKAAVLDSSGDAGKIITSAPGQVKIDGIFVGKSAHAGIAPETGISAIQIAAEAVSNMKLLRIDEETTANIGTFSCEGATNIVAEKVRFIAEARSLNREKLAAQTLHMTQCIDSACKKYGGKFEGKVFEMYQPYKKADSDSFVQEVMAACEKAGLKGEIASTGGGSDANNMNQNGISALVLGTGMSNVHTVNEYITVENLENTTRLVLELMK